MNWAVKYRPQNYEQLALNPHIKAIFDNIIKNQEMGDFLFYSPDPGCGKTSLAKMLPNLLNLESIFINASKNGNMDTIRNQIEEFMDYGSVDADGKMVILDEAERISMAAQESLRGILEEEKFDKLFFVFTVNDKNKLIKPISDSRLMALDFTLPNFDPKNEDFINSVFTPIVKYLETILQINKVEYDKKDLMTFIKREYPGIRRMVVKMQFSIFNNKFQPNLYGSNGIILNEENLLNIIKNESDDKIYQAIQKYNDGEFLISFVNDKLLDLVEIESISRIIELFNEYQTKQSLNLQFNKINFLDLAYKMKKEIIWK